MAGHRIFPHGDFEELASGVWRVRGLLSFPLHRNMIVVRLATGELLLHSVVALDDSGLAALDRLGKPSHAVVPSAMHQMDAPFYKARYPHISVLAPAEAVAAVARNVPVSGTVEEVMPSLGFRLHKVPGVKAAEYVYERDLAPGGRMLMVNDVFGSANAHDDTSLMGRLMVRRLAVPGNRLGIARIYDFRVVSDRAAIRRFAASLADIADLRLITVSHGDPVTDDPAGKLRTIAA